MADNRLIVALDVRSLDEAKKLVETLGETVNFYKVGMELFYRVGSSVLRYLTAQGKEVFLDLKLHDIPNTVAEGLCSLMEEKVSLLNVHASGGYTMMKTAAKRLREEAARRGVFAPKIVAVTVLTSLGEAEWREMGQTEPIAEKVVRLAKLAQRAGLDGVVASPQEAAAIRRACGNDFIIVTPGIRPLEANPDDQSRVASPAEALRNGATHLVVGRPIRTADNPRAAAQAILEEMRGV
ncbi:MAG: orotidine-5'-phosphate decarboxylase [Negativicutes bacterium]